MIAFIYLSFMRCVTQYYLFYIPRLTIQSIAQGETALPTSHTCFNILNIPDSYNSAAQLNNRFALALQHHEGFGLV